MMEAENDWEEGEEITSDDTDGGREERVRFITDRGQEPLRIDKFLHNRLEGATRNKVQQSLEDGNITVNGALVKSNYKVKPGDEVVVYETREQEHLELLPEEMELDVVYEDESLLIIYKQPGMVVHPGSGNDSGTLINGLAWYLNEKSGINTEGLHRVGLVHRIDKDTSGLLVIAKTEDAMSKLAAQFKKHTVHRRYIALAWGDFDEDEGTICVPVGRHPRLRKVMTTFPDGDQGKEATTHYTVLERFGYVTLLELRLETGRTHQIRVHMQSIGHPLFNDAMYGGDRIVKGTVFAKYKQFVENCFKEMPRQALHAKELGFEHPATREQMLFNSEIPDDLQSVLERWRVYTGGMTNTLRQQLNNNS